ncbi:hypothetical protein BOTNAR_0297g00110 [Botryotinia narcissicola]|uniref:Uncharacterized protein n=1 Tax=Botryotinia narcissicola TaxID=278944 RepID=A0A4Z1HVV0_9HELO|nr:hypothetical protein BOTNAR_0297g00110 [Botryotinia narcissicola]
MISLHYHRILLFFFLLFPSLILLFRFTYPHSLNFNLNLNPLSINNSNAPSRKQKYITQEGKPINQQTIIQLRAKINEGKYPALKKLLEDGVLGVGEQNGEKSGKGIGGEKIIHQLWHNPEGGFARRVERRGDGNVRVQEVDGGYGDGKGKGKIYVAEDKEGWEVSGGDGEIPREPLFSSSSEYKNEDTEGIEKLHETISSRIMGAPRNHGFVVELIDVLMGHNAPGVEGTRERERDRETGALVLTEKLMMGKREIFGEVWDAYHRRIEEGVLNVGVSVVANTSTSMGYKRGNSGREEMGLVDSVGWRVSVLLKGEGVGRGFFGLQPSNAKPPSPSKPQSKASHASPTHLLLLLLILVSISLLITLIFYSHYRSRTRKQPLLRRASSRYERGRRRERVLRSAGLGGGNGEFWFIGYGGGGYEGDGMQGMEKRGSLMIGKGEADGRE